MVGLNGGIVAGTAGMDCAIAAVSGGIDGAPADIATTGLTSSVVMGTVMDVGGMDVGGMDVGGMDAGGAAYTIGSETGAASTADVALALSLADD
mmetsp:Transcript_122423/g.238193  ORF Transcript_122423/g.238193 Transcript_122423/m.238193 type:complete len:94 (+) Transcript_122423:778-1059(+)